ncbi:IS3 family transposase [Paenibacillus larvae]|uniref:IS3 family transposase n=1 Tax=Paenibacillus larvae TaxID=1464 RepID=UPI0037C75C49
MSRKGTVWITPTGEFFGHFKSECLYIQSFESEEALKTAIDKYIRFYNYDRFRAKLSNFSPVEYPTLRLLRISVFNAVYLTGVRFRVPTPACRPGSFSMSTKWGLDQYPAGISL